MDAAAEQNRSTLAAGSVISAAESRESDEAENLACAPPRRFYFAFVSLSVLSLTASPSSTSLTAAIAIGSIYLSPSENRGIVS